MKIRFWDFCSARSFRTSPGRARSRCFLCRFVNEMRRPFNMSLFIGVVLVMLSFLCSAAEQEMLPYPPQGRVPPGYSADYATTVNKAEDEGALVIYSTTDVGVAQYL